MNPILSISRGRFVGRRQELRTLLSHLAEVRRGHARFVLLVGAAGMGKTRTAERFGAIARRLGCEVLWGGCDEWEGSPPYRPWVRALRGYLERAPDEERTALWESVGALARLVPELRPEGGPTASPLPALADPAVRFEMYDAVGRFLRRLSRPQPLVLVLDDLHWADDSSLLLLRFLTAELASAPVLMVGTAREADPAGRQSVRELVGYASPRTVQLRGLPRSDVARLVATTTAQVPAPWLVDRVQQLSEGNPFFVLETAGWWADRLPETVDDPAGPASVPESVLALIERRLDGLPSDARDLVRTAAVIGRTVDEEFLARLWTEGHDPESLASGLKAAARAGVLVPHGRRWRFRHAMIRRALYEELPPDRRVRLHARVARLLESAPEPTTDRAAELAYHGLRGEPVLGPAKVVAYSRRAAAHAMGAFAFDEAVSHYGRALERKDRGPPDAETVEILFDLGHAEAGRSPRWNRQKAWNHLQRAAELALSHGDVRRAAEAVTCPAITAEGAQGVAAAVERVLERIDAGSGDAARLLARHGAAVYFETGDRRPADASLDRALGIARTLGDPALELRALSYAVAVDHFDSRWADALRKSRRVLELARGVADPPAELYARYRTGFALAFMGRADEAAAEARAHLARAEAQHDRGMLEDALWINAVLAQLRGEWARARDLGDRGLRLAPRHLPLLHLRVLLEHERGEVERGREVLDRLLDAADHAGPYPLRGVFGALAMEQVADLTGERPPAGHQPARPGVDVPTATLLTAVTRTLAAIRRGDAAAAERELPLLERGRGTLVAPLMAHDRLLGRVAVTAARDDQAAEHFHDSLRFCREAGYAPELAWTCHDYARLLRDRGTAPDRRRAVALAEEGLALASRLGMQPLVVRLRALAGDVVSAGGLERLTARELEVLRVLATGRTNREIGEALFISPNTVAVHVARILEKTGARNRTEAATLAARQALGPPADSQP